MTYISYFAWWNLLHLSCILAVGVPNLHNRGLAPRDDDGLPFTGELGGLEGLGDRLEDGFKNLDDLLKDPIPETTPPKGPIPPKKDGSPSKSPSTTNSPEDSNAPVFNLQINQCQDNNPGATDSSNKCNVKTPTIVYPKICDQEKSKIITNALQNIPNRQGQVFISQDICGPFLWRVELSPSQIADLQKDLEVNDAILSILPDKPLGDDTPDSPNSPHQKRDVVVRREGILARGIPPCLTFLCDPNPRFAGMIDRARARFRPQLGADRMNYWYFHRSGQDVRIYMLGRGVFKAAPDFVRERVGSPSTSMIAKYIYAIGSRQTETDDSPNGSGTCRASVAAGQIHGVVDRSPIIVVKHISEISSLLDAILKTALDIQNTAKTKGYTVVVIDKGFMPENDENERRLRLLMRKLIFELRVVVVVAAGEEETQGQIFPRRVYHVPQIWSLDKELNLITVGAVNSDPAPQLHGVITDMTLVGDAITVSAPADVECASKGLSVTSWLSVRTQPNLGGTGASAAMVGGLAAYFLSLEDLGEFIRATQGPFIQKAVRDVLVYFAFSRRTGLNPPAISNGVHQWDFPRIRDDLLKIWR